MQVSGQATPGRRRASHPIGWVFGLLAAVLMAPVVLAGCASKAAPQDTSRAPIAAAVAAPQASPSGADGKVALAKANAMAAYAGYIVAETEAAQTADYGSPQLSKFTSDPLLGQWIAQLFHLHVIGDVQRGSVLSHPILVSLKLSAQSGTATVRDCLDQSAISIVNAQTGAAVPLPKPKPYVAIATLYLYSTGVWMVSKVDTTGSQPC
jgi:hypothetical protein